MKYLLFLLFPLSLSAQYRYSYTEAGIDSAEYELNVKCFYVSKLRFSIGIYQANKRSRLL